jgi:hypothetical protein
MVQTRSNYGYLIASCRAYNARRVACAIPEQFSSLASILAMTIFQWIIPALWLFFIVYWGISALGAKRSDGNTASVDAKPAASRQAQRNHWDGPKLKRDQ